jgi:hypothetical protein
MTDTDDFKKRIQASVEKYSKREDPTRPTRKNEAPERELQKEVIRWMNSVNFSVDNIESKAHYSLTAGQYMSQHQKPGIPDIVGNDHQGHAVYIELKSPGRRGTLRPNQREFLIRKINTNCFAICADSKEYILENFNAWLLLGDERKNFLLSLLPKEKPIDDSPLF